MKVLVVSPVLPWPTHTGYHVRIYNMICELSTRHDVDLVCPVEWSQQDVSEAERQLKQICSSVHLVRQPNRGIVSRGLLKMIFKILYVGWGVSQYEFYHNLWPFVKRVKALLAMKSFDILITNGWYTALRPVVMANLPTICDTLDVITDQFESRLAYEYRYSLTRRIAERSLRRIRCRETEILNCHDLLICVTERDISTLREKLSVVTPAIAIAHVRDRVRIPFESRVLTTEVVLFFGALGTHMNRDAAKYAAMELFPDIRESHPRSRLIIAGSNPGSEIRALGRRDGISVIDNPTTEALVDLIHNAKVVLLPLRIGSGIKGRVLEAMEAGTPVVGTPVAALGIPVTHGVDMVICDDADALVRWTVRLLADEELRMTIARRARTLVEENYSWENTYGRIHECLDLAIRRRSNSRLSAQGTLT
jgi:glycosyltransferase involved in cell wall biosynthesis